ncbi:LBL_2463 family protein [Leptospira alexanderi]|uniref:Uncharacterized protein n=1 Tax=Leptospira alexanderi serovar Manhao 3 str. L 60 TaxID=1049759 RepID=V6I5C3_9LEPT|nr:hypothetical protein [Leptospira alexanderi]EQA60609.1 hypothetical protein LEP1GSC062_0629 [Leptospira alexanderi serovar Manhao 3 str. L 60]
MSHLTLNPPSLNENRIQGLENPIELIRVKNFIQSIFSKNGYNKSPYAAVDLDPWSTWFYVTDSEKKILSAMRIVEKKPNNFLPIEMGVIYGSNPQKRYVVLEENVADWNNVAFLRTLMGVKAATINFKMVVEHCLQKNYSKVYGMYHQKLASIERIYLSAGAELSKRFSKPVFFPYDYIDQELVLLNIIEIDKTSLQKIHVNLM